MRFRSRNDDPRECCPACRESAESRRLGEKHFYTLFKCQSCGAVFPRPAPVSAETRDLYDRYYDRAEFVATPAAVRSLERLVRYAKRCRKTGRWLDVGFGEGALLTIAAQSGWSCYGTEASQRALEYGQAQNWMVTSDPESDPRFEAGSFDVVTMIELLEHVPQPARFLSDAARWLRQGGLLYITTPNVRGLNGRILGLKWSIVSPPEHIVLWTVPALLSALAKAGLQAFRVRAEGFNPGQMLAGTPWRRGETPPVDRNESAVALSEALSRTPARRALKTAINECLSVSRLGDTLKVWARHVG